MLKSPGFLFQIKKKVLGYVPSTCSLSSLNASEHIFRERSKQCSLAFSRSLGSNNGSVDKGIDKKNANLKYLERSVTFYTCENVYERWKKDKAFFYIPESGVFADINYVDTVGEGNDDKPMKTVLCIHGIPGNYAVFSHIINTLGEKRIRVVVPTFPETLYLPGKNGTQLFRHSVDEKTQVFKDFLKALKISKLDAIIAHSSAIYPALRLALDPELSVKCQAFFNTGGHKKTVTMKPYWIVWICTYLYLHPLGRKLIQKTGRFIMKHILRTPIKDENLDGIMLLAVTMVFSQYWKAKDQFEEIAKRQLPTLYCFSEDDKVVERKLTYEVLRLLGASPENVRYLDSELNVIAKGNEMSWLTIVSFQKGSHYVFRKYPEICNEKVLQLIEKIDQSKT